MLVGTSSPSAAVRKYSCGSSSVALATSGRRTRSESPCSIWPSVLVRSKSDCGAPDANCSSVPIATSISCISRPGSALMSISSNPRLRTEMGRSRNWGWTKTSKVSRTPTWASGGQTSARNPRATGVCNSTEMLCSAGSIWRSSLSRRAWICMNLRRLGDVTGSPDCWYCWLQGLQPGPRAKDVSIGPLRKARSFLCSAAVFSMPLLS